jgi:hypothetical protein
MTNPVTSTPAKTEKSKRCVSEAGGDALLKKANCLTASAVVQVEMEAAEGPSGYRSDVGIEVEDLFKDVMVHDLSGSKAPAMLDVKSSELFAINLSSTTFEQETASVIRSDTLSMNKPAKGALIAGHLACWNLLLGSLGIKLSKYIVIGREGVLLAKGRDGWFRAALHEVLLLWTLAFEVERTGRSKTWNTGNLGSTRLRTIRSR